MLRGAGEKRVEHLKVAAQGEFAVVAGECEEYWLSQSGQIGSHAALSLLEFGLRSVQERLHLRLEGFEPQCVAAGGCLDGS